MDTSPYDIYLINGNITIFFGEHSADFKKDILNSSLLANLVATLRSQTREQLFSEYANSVSKLCWIENSREFKHFDFSSKSLFKIAETGLGAYLTKAQKQNLLNAFLHLKKPPTQLPVIKTILDKLETNSFTPDHVMHGTSMKTPVASSTRLTVVASNASILTLGIRFKTTNGISMDILDQPILNSIKDGKTNMWLLVSSLDLREYDKLRATVIKKIGNHINTDILHVQTPNRLD